MVERYSMIGRDFGARMDVSSNGAWVRYCDLAAARAEIERLRKERDDARAQVAAAYGSAASIVVTGEPEISPITRHAITALTPADASAAIEAYGREKMRAGMKRAADIAAVKPRRGGRPLSGPHHAGIRRGRSEAARLILAEMEKLK